MMEPRTPTLRGRSSLPRHKGMDYRHILRTRVSLNGVLQGACVPEESFVLFVPVGFAGDPARWGTMPRRLALCFSARYVGRAVGSLSGIAI